MKRREVRRDERDFDKTQLKLGGHGKSLHRDYSAHFFRWSFARRFISSKTTVLEIGCGEEKPLSRILTSGAAAHVDRYVGVDLNKIKPSKSQRLTFYGEFDFTSRFQEVVENHGQFDVVVHLEVIEHMSVRNGRKLLRSALTCLKPGGTMLMSTPAYDGKRHAANHIHEYTISELQDAVVKAGFNVATRYGTFMDIKYIGRVESDLCTKESIREVSDALREYFDNDAISNIFGPLYSDHSRNNLWVCLKPRNKRGKK